MPGKRVSLLAVLLSMAAPAFAQFTQSGGKLVGSGGIGKPLQGTSVSLSADGSIAVVGGPADNTGNGAAWVYMRSNGASLKLLGSGAVGGSGAAGQGSSVAVSADGSTLVVGGLNDNTGTGAMWIFSLVNGVWTQQAKLWGTVLHNISHQGISVAVSADGSTALIGGPLFSTATGSSTEVGAAWVFNRVNGVWDLPGQVRLGDNDGASVLAHQGTSVALSADGNTALVGGPGDNNGAGAAWVFTRAAAGSPWVQQGNKLTGSDATLGAGLGTSVALSADGNTALVGGPGDNNIAGAVWVFTRSGGQWRQQGGKLVGSGFSPSRYLGMSVALSGDGNTAVVGGPGGSFDVFGRSPAIGNTWVFVRNNGAWSQQGAALQGSGSATNDALQGTAVAISADGRTAMVGGPADNSGAGATWVFTQPVSALPPVISTQPASQTVASGQTVTLNVGASGPGPLTFQWYQGASGNTPTPVGTNSASFTTPALTSTTNYWVRVSNSFGSVNSNTAVVTVSVSAPVISSVSNAASDSATIAPNTWVAIQGANLATAGDTRIWQGSDFVNNQLPVQLDGISATVNGRSAYVYYISPTQLNILTPPDAMPAQVQVQVTNGGVASAPFAVQAQAATPSFFTIGGGTYVAAEHANGSYLGPTSLYPGVTTPARPGETVVLYGNGFGPTSPLVFPGSLVQSASLPSLPVIIIGGTPATVQFAGLVAPGEFQFNVVVPLSAPDGDNVLTAVYNGLATQTGVLLTVAH